MSYNSDIATWLKQNLEEILNCLVTDNIIEYIMTIEDFRDVQDYLKTLVDTTNPRYAEFLKNFKKIRSLQDAKEDDILEQYSLKQKGNKKGSSDLCLKDKKSNVTVSSSVSEMMKDNTEKQSVKKKKNKYVNLYSAEGKEKDVIMLKGRHKCDCQASKHKLVNNCLKCGRIVCEQEGKGPCLFCGLMVFSRGDKSIINSNTAQSRELYNTIMECYKLEDLNKAVERRDKLLDFDQTSAQRTKVIDDEGEYYSSNSVWLSKEEREKLQKKEEEEHRRRHASRLEKKFTLDFAGRTVIEDIDNEEQIKETYEEVMNKIEESLSERMTSPATSQLLEIMLQYEMSHRERDGGSSSAKLDGRSTSFRVQDRELLEMTDSGVCLSMHQPWASLLVCGIKKDEGRTWYTSHRGRLWIAATAKHPTEEEIKDAERFYHEMRGDENVQFPKSYPTSCLLGCVSVVDCLPQEEYRLRYPDGESESPYVFVCEDPRRLDTLFPISGSHKIYKLDTKIHQAANKILLRMAKAEKEL